LDNVDLEARRQMITQAFNKTIRENAQKEKFAADRRRKARERAAAEEAAHRNDSSRTIRPTDGINSFPTKNDVTPTGDEGDADVFQASGEEFRASERALRVSTSTASDHGAVLHIVRDVDAADVMDSPTLGRVSEYRTGPLSRSHSHSEANDVPPWSAVTAETDGTIFDNEPQIDPPESRSANRTVLSQIMDMRGASPADSPALSENGSEQADKESVQIVLRETTYLDDNDQPHRGLGAEHENQRAFLSDDKGDQWSTSSWTSSIRERSSPEGPLEPIVAKPPYHSSPRRNYHTRSTTTLNKKAGAETQSPVDTRAYNSVSRVLEKEHPVDAVNQNHFGDIYQKILQQSPDLARQGGWDTQRVTQLCLQEIDNSKYERLSKASSPLNKKQETRGEVSAVPDPQSLTPEKPAQGHKYRASLNNAEDFAFTSPSIVDWMQFAAADSPTDEGQEMAPPLPPKDLSPSPTAKDGTSTPRPEHTSEASSVGLNIHIRSPIKTLLSQTPPPRLPSHSPPSLPHAGRSIGETSGALVQSPSVYEDEPLSSTFLQKSFPPHLPQVPRRITSLSRMAPASHSTDALLGSSKDSVSPASGSFFGERPSLEQPSFKSTSQRASPSPEQKRIIQRRHVIKELVDTEASFGRDMSVVDDIYNGTSSSCLDLSTEDAKILFGNSDQIVKFSMDFLDSLKQAVKNVYVMPKSQRFQSKRNSRAESASTLATTASDDQSTEKTDETTDLDKDRRTFIGEAFKKNLGEMEKVYAVYLKNHDAANRKLQALQQSPEVGVWLKECRRCAADLTNAWDLDSLLVKPVQRLLKYPLFLTQLLETTPEDHPDREGIRGAMRDLTEVSIRINEMKKHSELVEQGLKRGRKESDVRIGFTKALGRQTEKLRQNVGVSRVVEDREYAQLQERYSENLAHLVLVIEDVKTYMSVASKSTERFNEIVLAIDGWIDVGHTGFPQKESRWRQLGIIVRELVTVAVPEHIGAIQKAVVDPMTAAAKMLEALLKDPKGLIQKRDKKSIDYARWRNVKDRGEKLDKKTSDRMEEWEALNKEAKGRMTKLIDLTSHLARGCLKSYVRIQSTWLMIWQHKLTVVVETMAPDISNIAREWQEDFDYQEAQALALGICNGSLLAEAVNLLNITTPVTTLDGASSPHQPSWIGAGKRSFSTNSDASPSLATEFTPRHSGSFTASPMAEIHDRGQYPLAANRMRTISATSGPSTASDVAPRNGSMTALNTAASQGASIVRPSTSAGSSGRRSPKPPRLSLDAPSPTIGTIKARTTAPRPDSGSTFYSAYGGRAQGSGSFSPSPIPRTTTTGSSTFEIFSSALPMSESPLTPAPPPTTPGTEDRGIDVLFLAASVYEFNIDRARREAGFPYLTYVTGEIFDVIAERGELWLARNQDDPEKQIGWIWNKHFAKLAET
jgi:dynamin-binding protein